MSQYHSPDGGDGCCINSNMFVSRRIGAFRHAYGSRGFVSVSWAFLFSLRTMQITNSRQNIKHRADFS